MVGPTTLETGRVLREDTPALVVVEALVQVPTVTTPVEVDGCLVE